MVNVAGVRFKKAGKIYYFDPAGFPVEAGTNVIVERQEVWNMVSLQKM